jgi:hypothetical protein
VIPLRPLGVGEILDGAITTIRAHAKPILGVSAMVAAISELLILGLQWGLLGPAGLDPNAPNEVLFASAGITAVVDLFTQLLVSAFVTVVVGRAVLGQSIGFGGAWSEVRPRLLPLLGLMLIYSLLVMITTPLLLIPAIWLAVRYVLAGPALVLERAPIRQSLHRSSQLVRGSWWRIFGILVLATIISVIITLIIEMLFGTISGVVDPGTGDAASAVASTLVMTLGVVIGKTITYSFVNAVYVLLYVDQRIRREGLDIQLAGMAGVAPNQPGSPSGFGGAVAQSS